MAVFVSLHNRGVQPGFQGAASTNLITTFYMRLLQRLPDWHGIDYRAYPFAMPEIDPRRALERKAMAVVASDVFDAMSLSAEDLTIGGRPVFSARSTCLE